MRVHAHAKYSVHPGRTKKTQQQLFLADKRRFTPPLSLSEKSSLHRVSWEASDGRESRFVQASYLCGRRCALILLPFCLLPPSLPFSNLSILCICVLAPALLFIPPGAPSRSRWPTFVAGMWQWRLLNTSLRERPHSDTFVRIAGGCGTGCTAVIKAQGW